MSVLFATQWEEDEDILVEEDIEQELDNSTGLNAKLIVYNDDVNTFEWVITCFIRVLGHTQEQAEQLSYIIHYRGKATVKNDSEEALKPFKDALIERGLSAVIEK